MNDQELNDEFSFHLSKKLNLELEDQNIQLHSSPLDYKIRRWLNGQLVESLRLLLSKQLFGQLWLQFEKDFEK